MAETIGQTIDTDVAALKARVASLEAAAIAKEHAAWTWVKANIAHAPTYVALGYAFAKHLL